MDNGKFARKLLCGNYKNSHEVLGDLLSKIFYDVNEYEDGFNIKIDVSEKFNDKYNTLGSYFKNEFNHGIFNI